ncbi:MAG: 1-acyl-sn-glycerol-3-phosphate acyltransferase [Anaerolineaceae bacterium]|nr:1-acyl-sn-glycerol-3-phosphate acyltransferase [Anaerolineaceae bacterium]
MSLTYQVVTTGLKVITGLLCRVDDAQISKIPLQGPLILAVNHINILDIPTIYTRALPRRLTAFVKAEAWDSLIYRGLMSLWKGIPLHRGQSDFAAFRQALEMLEDGYIVAVSPEGTRSGDGHLLEAHSGVVLLALRSGVPVLPLVFYGHEHVWKKTIRLRRSDFKVVVGCPFQICAGETRVNGQVARQMLNEVMYQLAALLPPQYRGVYADLNKASERYLSFLDENELQRA